MILVDHPRECVFRGRVRQTAHMMSDLASPADATAELTAMAGRIGLRAQWLQKAGTETEHFDLFDGAIERALAAGAEAVGARDLITRVVQPRRSALRGER